MFFPQESVESRTVAVAAEIPPKSQDKTTRQEVHVQTHNYKSDDFCGTNFEEMFSKMYLLFRVSQNIQKCSK